MFFQGTMSEIEKALMELEALMKYRTEQLGYEEDFRGLGLTSRKNLCLHPSVKREKSGSVVDARCRSLTAGFVKEKKERGEDVDVCVYHDVRTRPILTFAVFCRNFADCGYRISICWSRIISSPPASGHSMASCAMEKSISSVHISQLVAWYAQ